MRNIIIDCDPGHDDAIALLVALAHPEEFNILGVTTVAGNQTIDKVTDNVLKMFDYLGVKNIPVSKGYSDPLLRKVQTAAFVHGDSGLDGPILPPATSSVTGLHAVEFLKKAISESKEKVTLIPLGPLTNIAIFLKTYPELKEKIETIALMGGSIYSGNIVAKGEFNIWQDAEASKIVFDSGVPIIMAGTEVCNEGGVLFSESKEFAKGGKVSRFAYDVFEFYSQYCAKNGWDKTVIYDMTPIIYLIHPELFQAEQMRVDIETQGEYCRGCTVCDDRGGAHIDKCENPKTVLTHLQREPFVQVLFDDLKKLDQIYQ